MYNFDVALQTKKCIEWIRRWFTENGNADTEAIVGISGGKDSSVVAALLKEALTKDRVIGITMPQGTQIDINDSNSVINHLGIKSYEINIGTTYDALCDEITSKLESDIKNVNNKRFLNDSFTTNTPARLRMTTLYSIGAIIGNVRIANTCNLSEDLCGYSTLWGDSVGDFAPISKFTTDEVIKIGDYLGLPYNLTHKTPIDGMSKDENGDFLPDEKKLGFSYKEVNELIRENKKGINYDSIISKYNSSKFKLDIIKLPYYDPKLDICI